MAKGSAQISTGKSFSPEKLVRSFREKNQHIFSKTNFKFLNNDLANTNSSQGGLKFIKGGENNNAKNQILIISDED